MSAVQCPLEVIKKIGTSAPSLDPWMNRIVKAEVGIGDKADTNVVFSHQMCLLLSSRVALEVHLFE